MTFDRWQQIYCLSAQSGLIGNYGPPDGGSAAVLAKWLDSQIRQFLAANSRPMGWWYAAWGPAVFQAPGSTTADNVMYVAADTANKTYVVCVAGTNPKSQEDILNEDAAVNTTTPWASAFPSIPGQRKPASYDPFLSAGTARGVNYLLGLTDPDTGKSLLQYLKSVESKDATVTFTGHSLGGALSPTLALALFNSTSGPLRKSDWRKVAFYTTAGPTPGNASLAAFLRDEFPPEHLDTSYQGWNVNVVNTLDAVPQGWSIQLMAKQTELYNHVKSPWPPTDKPPPFYKDLQDIISLNISLSQAGAEYKPDGKTAAGPYTPIASLSFPGTQHADNSHPQIFPELINSTQTWTYQAGYQHIEAYDSHFRVESVSPRKPAAAVPVAVTGETG